MAREAVIVEVCGVNGGKRSFTCASGTAIPYGTLMKMTDPRTAIASTGAAATAGVAAGIASMAKASDDGKTRITVYTDVIAECYASGAITLGAPISFIQDNYVCQTLGASITSGAVVAGYCMETASDGEVVNCRITL